MVIKCYGYEMLIIILFIIKKNTIDPLGTKK